MSDTGENRAYQGASGNDVCWGGFSDVTLQQKIYREFVLPGVFPFTIIAITVALIILVGETLLALVNVDANSELATARTLGCHYRLHRAFLGVCSFLATRPEGSLGKLDEPIMIGSRPMLADPLPPVDVSARRGPVGTIDDISAGYALYARNGQVGVARELLRDVPGEFSHLRKGFIYAQGVFGANDQMWVPIEAVSAVYPETRAAFLAIGGDEIEAYGWQKPPAVFNLYSQSEENKLY